MANPLEQGQLRSCSELGGCVGGGDQDEPAVPQSLSQEYDKQAHPEHAEPASCSAACHGLEHPFEDDGNPLHHKVDAAAPPQVETERFGWRRQGRNGSRQACVREVLRMSVREGRGKNPSFFLRKA